MDIVTKNTRKAFYQVSNELAAVLLELGMVEKIEKPAPAPRENEWGIGKTMSGCICINLRLPSGELRTYDGLPERAADGFKHRQWSGAAQAYVFDGPVPPANIVEQYVAQYRPHVFANGGPMEEFMTASRPNRG